MLNTLLHFCVILIVGVLFGCAATRNTNIAEQPATDVARDDLAGRWVGQIGCTASLEPAEMNLRVGADGRWLAEFTVRGVTSGYRITPPGSYENPGSYTFKALGSDKAPSKAFAVPLSVNATSIGSSLFTAAGKMRWMKVSVLSACGKGGLWGTQAYFYKHQPISSLGGSYAKASGDFAAMCRAIATDWLGDIATEERVAAGLKARFPDALKWYSPKAARRAQMFDPQRFIRAFGALPYEIDDATFGLLRRQTSSCATIGPAGAREAIATALYNGQKPNWTGSIKPETEDDRYLDRWDWSRDVLAYEFNNHVSSLELAKNRVRQALAATSTVALDGALRLGGLAAIPPSDLVPLLEPVAQRRQLLAGTERKSAEVNIARNGAPKVTLESLQRALHEQLQATNERNGNFFGAILRVPGRTMSRCDEEYCFAMGGIVKFRFVSSEIVSCQYPTKTAALCRFRMYMDVESTMSAPGDIRNQMVGAAGKTPKLMSANLVFKDLNWTLVGRLQVEQK